jgi:lauroyl/myristoyl acyltransferase
MTNWKRIWCRQAYKMVAGRGWNSRSFDTLRSEGREDEIEDPYDWRKYNSPYVEGPWGLARLGIANTLSFPLGARLMSKVFKNPRLQKRRYSSLVETYQQLFHSLPLSDGDQAAAIGRMLMLMKMRLWRLSFMGKCCMKTQFPRWFPVEGIEKYDAALARGKGVVLVACHAGESRSANRWLARLGYHTATVGARDIFRLMGLPPSPLIEEIPLYAGREARAVVAATRFVRKGKTLVIAPDAFRGDTGGERNFLGKSRAFPAGFAWVAVNAGAIVMPYSCLIDGKGVMHIKFYEPLDSGTVEDDAEERVDRLFDGYIQFLERIWRQDPGNIQPTHARHFLRLPRAK